MSRDKRVRKFKYLETVVGENGELDEEVGHRTQGIRLRNKRISARVKEVL